MNRAPRPTRRLIRAGEIGQFVYCRRAWWLAAIAGEKPANVQALAHGAKTHAAHGRTLMASRALRMLALGLMAIAALLLVFAR